MKGKISEIAARLIVEAWYRDAMENFDPVTDAWAVNSHFDSKRVGDVFDTDLPGLVTRYEADGWYLMHDPGQV